MVAPPLYIKIIANNAKKIKICLVFTKNCCTFTGYTIEIFVMHSLTLFRSRPLAAKNLKSAIKPQLFLKINENKCK